MALPKWLDDIFRSESLRSLIKYAVAIFVAAVVAELRLAGYIKESEDRVTTTVTTEATKNQETVKTEATQTRATVEDSEQQLKSRINKVPDAVAKEAAKVAVNVAEKVAEAKAEEVVPVALEQRLEKLEEHAEAAQQ